MFLPRQWASAEVVPWVVWRWALQQEWRHSKQVGLAALGVVVVVEPPTTTLPGLGCLPAVTAFLMVAAMPVQWACRELTVAASSSAASAILALEHQGKLQLRDMSTSNSRGELRVVQSADSSNTVSR